MNNQLVKLAFQLGYQKGVEDLEKSAGAGLGHTGLVVAQQHALENAPRFAKSRDALIRLADILGRHKKGLMIGGGAAGTAGLAALLAKALKSKKEN